MKVNKSQIKEIVASMLEIDASEIGDTDNFVKDFAMSSLMMLDCISEIEDVYDIRIPKNCIAKMNCIEKVVEYLESLEKTEATVV